MIGRPRSIRRVDPLGGQYGALFIEREIGVTHHIDGMGEPDWMQQRVQIKLR
jgi:hypothetical protein